MIPKQSNAKKDGVINPLNYNSNKFKHGIVGCSKNVTNQQKTTVEIGYMCHRGRSCTPAVIGLRNGTRNISPSFHMLLDHWNAFGLLLKPPDWRKKSLKRSLLHEFLICLVESGRKITTIVIYNNFLIPPNFHHNLEIERFCRSGLKCSLRDDGRTYAV